MTSTTERTLATFAPDRGRYWRDHAVMAVAFMALAGVVLWWIEAPGAAIGSLGAVAAVGLRAWYLASETLGLRWVLTDRRVILPDGQTGVPLSSLSAVRPILGAVQLVTTGGDKHLIRHLADPAACIAAIERARR